MVVVKVICHDTSRFAITIDGQTTIMKLGDKRGPLELFDFGGLVGLSFTSSDGIYHRDISGSGTYILTRVEDASGNLLQHDL